MDSTLIVCDEEKDNYKCRAEQHFTFVRNEYGHFEPINIVCDYETGYGLIYLRICLINFKKVYIYALDYYNTLYSTDHADYQICFYLNDIVNKIDPSKTYHELEVCIFTCMCMNKNCECELHSEYSGYDIENVTITRPIFLYSIANVKF